MKDSTHRVLLLLDALVFAGPTTALAWFWTVPALLTAESSPISYLFSAAFAASSISLIGFWVLIFRHPNDRARSNNIWWLLVALGTLLTALGAVLALISIAGAHVPDQFFGFFFCLYGLPVLVPLAHLLWLRSRSRRANNSFKPNPLRGSA